MAQRSPSSTSWGDLSPCDLPTADSPAPSSQGGFGNEANADVGWKTEEEVDHLLAKLEKEGVEIDGKIASIIDDGIGKIKAQARRENVKETKREGMSLLHIIGCMAVGFIMGAEWYERAFRAANAKRGRALDEKLAKSRRA